MHGKDEQGRGKWIALSHSPGQTEEFISFSIDANRGRCGGQKVANPETPASTEAPAMQHFQQKFPRESVKCLCCQLLPMEETCRAAH
jgi:hypothetical protein